MTLIPEDNSHAHINLSIFSLRGFSLCCLRKTDSNFSVCRLHPSVTISTRECGVRPVPLSKTVFVSNSCDVFTGSSLTMQVYNRK